MENTWLTRDLQDREGIWDIHSHILPGIDDGSRNWDMTLDMLQESRESGVRTIIATPHYLPWRKHPYPVEQVYDLCLEARERLRKERDLDMVLLPGQELYYYRGLLEDLRSGRCLTIAGTRVILVEFEEGDGSYSEMHGALTGLLRAGYRVVLAHAERYLCLREKGRLESLIGEGVYIQSNLQEVSGGRLDSLARWVRKQYLAGNIHCTASDMHNLSRRPPMQSGDIKWLVKKLAPEYVDDLLGGNIKKLLFSE